MTRDSLFADARATPLTRGAIEELAKRVPIDLVVEHAPAAIEMAGPHVATVLASAIVASGRKLAPPFARALLTELDGVALFGPIFFATDGDRVAMLAEFLEDAHATWERETLALFLAAESVGESHVDEKLVVHARRLARNELEGDTAVLLGATALRIGDEELVKLAAPYVTKAKKQKRIAEQALADARRPLLDALGDAAPRVVGGDYTVRKAGPDVGRNDPCPCGSGKKYKKCCALKPAGGDGAPASFEPPRIDEATLHPEQARELRASELAKLDLSRVPTRALPWVYRRALVFRRWAFAEKALDVLAKRADRKGEIDTYRLEMLDHALDSREAAVAESVLEKIGKERVPAALRLDVACVRGEADIAAIEDAAKTAIKTENDGLEAVELAFVLLRNYPALGILAARGALHEGRADDSKSLLQGMEDARDRAMLPPFEPWWELYDALVADARERRKTRLSEAEREQMAKEVRRARAESRGATAEVDKMRRRLEELDAALSAKAAEPAPTSKPEIAKSAAAIDSAELEEERRRLRMKVDELQRIIGEGQHERRELRQQLSELAEQRVASGARDDKDEERDAEDDALDEGDVEERPRGILVPVYSDRAAKSVTELDDAPAEAALALVAALAAGRENAWGGIKRLTKARGVYSARAGIHHRILFGIDEKTLRVHEIIHRRDLEQAVNRVLRL
ncbi:MAG TPA: SEC-C metal-binding domain-containing protein [Labilithrix sp.]